MDSTDAVQPWTSTAIPISIFPLKIALRAHTTTEEKTKAFHQCIDKAQAASSLARLPIEVLLIIKAYVFSALKRQFYKKWRAIERCCQELREQDLGTAHSLAMSNLHLRDDVRKDFRMFGAIRCDLCEEHITNLRCNHCQEILRYQNDKVCPASSCASTDDRQEWPPLTDEYQPDEIVDFDNPVARHPQRSEILRTLGRELSECLLDVGWRFESYLQGHVIGNTFITCKEQQVLQQLGMYCWTGLAGKDSHECEFWVAVLIFRQLPEDSDGRLTLTEPVDQPLSTEQLSALRRTLRVLGMRSRYNTTRSLGIMREDDVEIDDGLRTLKYLGEH